MSHLQQKEKGFTYLPKLVWRLEYHAVPSSYTAKFIIFVYKDHAFVTWYSETCEYRKSATPACKSRQIEEEEKDQSMIRIMRM